MVCGRARSLGWRTPNISLSRADVLTRVMRKTRSRDKPLVSRSTLPTTYFRSDRCQVLKVSWGYALEICCPLYFKTLSTLIIDDLHFGSVTAAFAHMKEVAKHENGQKTRCTTVRHEQVEYE